MNYKNGLPIINIPLPSRKIFCCFFLKPINENVNDFCRNIASEDKGIDFLALYTLGNRIAGSTSIENLILLGDFKIRINDEFYVVRVPSIYENDLTSVKINDKLQCIDDLRAMIASLHASLNINEFKLERERILLQKLEEINDELKILEKVKLEIEIECKAHSERIMWTALIFMCLQAGFFARLTWWEYSWDIMEPITYFATFATAIASFAYYLYTKQSSEISDMKNRYYIIRFHKLAVKKNFDIVKYYSSLNLFYFLIKKNLFENLKIIFCRDPKIWLLSYLLSYSYIADAELHITYR
ncbi:unnamed protein product [Dracunculus medinensis]|uniref:Calcium uniporter protein n=1 Tax=Dracunculus medinensis TaxID=318479 RepID=A0A0N4U0Y4_DRAME|nr:unnamed protein product [Dracunculus medinensis]